MDEQAAKRVISVGGGKGGVGKSIVAANLAVGMAQAGAKVVVVDVDLGAANQHTLFGVDKPGPTLQALLEKKIEKLDDAVVPTCVPNLLLVPGSSAVVGAANINFQQKLKLIRHVRALEADAVVVDVGAGVSFNVLDLFDAADLRMIVMTPQLTAMQNAYAFVKGAVFRELRRLAHTPEKQALIDESPEAGAANRRIPDLIRRIAEKDPAFSKLLFAGLASFGARVIGNQLGQPNDMNIVQAISRMTSEFLGVDTPVVGTLKTSNAVANSVQTRRPFMIDAKGDDENAVVLRQIARQLLELDVEGLRQTRAALAPAEGSSSAEGEAPAEPKQKAAVFCKATLIYSAGSVAVNLLAVSEDGARVSVDRPPTIGARAVLVVGSLPDRPSVPCIVRAVSAEERWVDVEFLAQKTLTHKIADELSKRYPAAAPAA